VPASKRTSMTGMVGWAAWKVSSPEWLPLLKGGADGECDWYVWITCPNGCGRFRTTAASVRKNKSSVCRTHIKLRSCQPEDEAPVNVFPSQRCRTVATIHQGCNERIAALQQNVSELQESRDSHETRIEQLELRVVDEVGWGLSGRWGGGYRAHRGGVGVIGQF